MNKRSNLQEKINKLEQELNIQKKKSKNTQVITILVVFVMSLILNNLNISAENSYTSEEVSYDNTNSSGLTSPNVQGALDGLYQAATDYNDIKTNKADKTATVSTVGWDSTNKKLTKTINGTTSDVVAGSTILDGLTKSQVTTALGYTPPTTDTNTWRGIQDNLSSTSTTDCLSAAQGKSLNDNKAAKSATVSTVAWDSTNKKLTKTINGSTTDVVTGATILGGLTKSQVTTALGYTPPTTDTNTWRGIQNNLTSTSTSDCLSAAQGKALNDNKLPKEPDQIELGVHTTANDGGNVDFHWKKSTANYTSRIIEDAEGRLNIIANNGLNLNSDRLIVTKEYYKDNLTVAANSTANTGNVSITLSGYTPVMVTCNLANASSSGTLYSFQNVYECVHDSSNAVANVRNYYNGQAKIKVKFKVLYVRSAAYSNRN